MEASEADVILYQFKKGDSAVEAVKEHKRRVFRSILKCQQCFLKFGHVDLEAALVSVPPHSCSRSLMVHEMIVLRSPLRTDHQKDITCEMSSHLSMSSKEEKCVLLSKGFHAQKEFVRPTKQLLTSRATRDISYKHDFCQFFLPPEVQCSMRAIGKAFQKLITTSRESKGLPCYEEDRKEKQLERKKKFASFRLSPDGGFFFFLSFFLSFLLSLLQPQRYSHW